MKLELGSGYHPTVGWTHLDLNPHAPHVEIVGPAWPLDLADESCEALRAVDVLEHIGYRHTDEALAEWARVLRPGGQLYVQVPDADRIMHWYAEEPARLVERLPGDLPTNPLAGACWRLMGGQDDDVQAFQPDEADYNLHRSLFSLVSLTRALERVGLQVAQIEVNDHPNVCAHAVKP